MVKTRNSKYSITLNGVTYFHKPNSEDFYVDNTDELISAFEVMERGLPKITNSFSVPIDPPRYLFKFNETTQAKIIRIIQLCLQKPPVTEETNKFVEFFEHLAKIEYNYRHKIAEQWRAALFATRDYNSITKKEDKEQAASLILHYGFTPNYNTEVRISSMYQFQPHHDGVYDGVCLEVEYNHTLNDRLQAACSDIEKAIRNGQANSDYLYSLGMRKFYNYENYYISIIDEYRRYVEGYIRNFIADNTNAWGESEFIYPTISELKPKLREQEFKFSVRDFYGDDDRVILEYYRYFNDDSEGYDEALLFS